MPKKLISVGQLIDHSWDIYRENFSGFLSVSGWFLLVAILNVIALAFYPSVSTLADSAALSGLESFGVTLYAVTAYIVSPIVTFWIFIALARATTLARSKKPLDLKKIIKETKPRFIPAVLVAVLVFLVLIASHLIGFFPYGIFLLLGILLKSSGVLVFSNVLLLLGMIVAAVLMVRWTVYYIMAPYVNVLDDVQKTQALTESKKLIKGKFLHVSFLIIVPKLVFVLFGVFLMMVFVFITQLISAGLSELNTDLYVRILTISDSVLPILIVVLINPLIIISDVLLYKSLKGEEI